MLPGILEGPRLRLRPLHATDRDALFSAASDPKIWESHPVKTRYQRQTFDPYFDFLLSTGESYAAIDISKDLVIGTSRFYLADHPPGSQSIGYTFLARAYWGGPANFEMKTLMIDHILRSADAVWFHIDAHNLRSRKATEKLGAKLAFRDQILDFGNGPAAYWGYRLDAATWRKVKEHGSGSA